MKNIFFCCAVVFALAACAGNSSTDNTQMYGQIKGGVEHSRTF